MRPAPAARTILGSLVQSLEFAVLQNRSLRVGIGSAAIPVEK